MQESYIWHTEYLIVMLTEGIVGGCSQWWVIKVEKRLPGMFSLDVMALDGSTYRGFWGVPEDNIKLSGHLVELWFRLSLDKLIEIHILRVPLACDL